MSYHTCTNLAANITCKHNANLNLRAKQSSYRWNTLIHSSSHRWRVSLSWSVFTIQINFLLQWQCLTATFEDSCRCNCPGHAEMTKMPRVSFACSLCLPLSLSHYIYECMCHRLTSNLAICDFSYSIYIDRYSLFCRLISFIRLKWLYNSLSISLPDSCLTYWVLLCLSSGTDL